ncbi:MAG: glycoside hydrolase family 15, partial [Actinomycetota bacterium]|nr:glycoside hydrolase family 15 [Actinomycetota bacterium]
MDEPTAPAPRLTRRTLLGSGGAVILAAGTGFGGLTLYRSRHVDVPLYSETVALEGAGRSVLVAPGRAADVVDGTRVLRSAREAADLVAQERAWLATGASWTTAGPWSSVARDALLDLRALTLPDGIPVAGWSTGWRYVWPRDAAHHAAALAVSGHADEALPALRFLSRVQDPSGWFEARYLPDGSGPPDGRTRQLDGTGWAMWATQQVAQAMPPDAARRLVTELRPMLDRSVGLIRTLV